jgi:uncharacterized protein YjbI with pentapeptide repeats
MEDHVVASNKLGNNRELITTRRDFDELLVTNKLAGRHIAHIDLSEIDLRKAQLSQTRWSNVYLRGANFAEANLNGAQFRYVCLDQANLDGASLIRTDWNIDANGRRNFLRRASLRHAQMQQSVLCHVVFLQSNLSYANFRQVDLTRAILNSCHCLGTDFADSRLTLCEAKEACLNGAMLTRCDLSCMNLSGASLENTDFNQANLQGVISTDSILFHEMPTKQP